MEPREQTTVYRRCFINDALDPSTFNYFNFPLCLSTVCSGSSLCSSHDLILNGWGVNGVFDYAGSHLGSFMLYCVFKYTIKVPT